MATLRSHVRAESAEFRANVAANGSAVAELRARLAAVQQGGSAESRRRHQERGKLPQANLGDLMRLRMRPQVDAGIVRDRRHTRDIPLHAVQIDDKTGCVKILDGHRHPVPSLCCAASWPA